MPPILLACLCAGQAVSYSHADNISQSASQNDRVTAIDLSTMGKRVAHMRERRGLSQTELARATGFKQPSISDLENDRTKDVSARLLGAVSIALSTSWEFLLVGERNLRETDDAVAESELLGIYRALGDNAKVSLLEFARHLRNSSLSAAVSTVSTQTQTPAQQQGTKKPLGRFPGEIPRTDQAGSSKRASDRPDKTQAKRGGGRP
jgi:transcriptional regulator with XRE-family HTH domain